MKYFFSLLAVLCVTLPLLADDAIRPMTTDLPRTSNPSLRLKETALLDHLIEATAQNLESQKQLKQLLQDYLQLQQQYAQNTQDKQLSFRMVKKAHELLEKIQEQHLTQAFDQEMLSELTFFSNIATKWNTVK